ncbi:hypothetical protein JMK10_14135 [Rhodovulum sulfidophilum]|uniref:RyR domain-containing protein n=1 Tax=Rhodovulum sulfidophilum TaxID=35806 RepID=UPI0019237F6C|nr:RyR domain-containing protein [Rhodovulum sulfidophilum]MBL3572835.1 hypothetical protein [Rhodovulum sulfidophilum]MCE8431128.1 hypothetical protein [Rhodovulum sulfidophilum]MCF4117925.1 hypothetical protein [Rhodovulum sulfidophilum]
MSRLLKKPYALRHIATATPQGRTRPRIGSETERKLGLTLVLTVLMGTTTVATGTLGWMIYCRAAEDIPKIDFWEAFYRSLQALTLADSYVPATVADTPLLFIARFTGFLTTLSAFIALVLGLLGAEVAIFAERCRRNHVVIFSDDGFVLSYFLSLNEKRRKNITIFTRPEDEPALRDAHCPGLRVFPMPSSDTPIFGKPAEAVFADRNSIRNFELARRLRPRLKGASLTLRIEHAELSGLKCGLPDELMSARVVSRNQITAEALIGSVDFGGIAEIRGNIAPHIAIIGFGSCAISIVEEIALRNHRPGQCQPVISVLDCAPAEARRRLLMLRPGLLAALDIEFVPFDGLICNTEGGLETLERVERRSITSVVVATGQDELNMAIGLRLAQVQRQQLICKAPIFVRNSRSETVSPEPLRDLTGGLYLFGGGQFDSESLAMQRISEHVARAIHEAWLQSQPAEDRGNKTWEKTTPRNRASSRRAALSGIELLRAAGLAPEPGEGFCGFRSFRPHVERRINEQGHVAALAKTEHDRWMAEKLCDGYTRAPDGKRDDERRLHPLLMPFHDLSQENQKKDCDQISTILNGSAARFDRRPESPCWRLRLRIGVTGCLQPSPETLKKLETIFQQLTELSLPVPISEATLEVVSPNAPGFDRIAATAILGQYRKATKRRGQLLLLQAIRAEALDGLAADQVNPKDASDQRHSLLAAAGRHVREVDLRPAGMSDVDMLSADRLGVQLEHASQEMNRLCDLIVFGVRDRSAKHSRDLLELRRSKGRPSLVI